MRPLAKNVVQLSKYRRRLTADGPARPVETKSAIRPYMYLLPDGRVRLRTYTDDGDRLALLLFACNKLAAQLIAKLPSQGSERS